MPTKDSGNIKPFEKNEENVPDEVKFPSISLHMSFLGGSISLEMREYTLKGEKLKEARQAIREGLTPNF